MSIAPTLRGASRRAAHAAIAASRSAETRAPHQIPVLSVWRGFNQRNNEVADGGLASRTLRSMSSLSLPRAAEAAPIDPPLPRQPPPRLPLSENPMEFIILYTHKFRCGMDSIDEHKRFVSELTTCFPDYANIAMKRTEFNDPLKELQRKGRRILFLYGRDDVLDSSEIELHSPGKVLWDTWHNVESVKELHEKVLSSSAFISHNDANAPQLRVCQLILSPSPLLTVKGGFVSVFSPCSTCVPQSLSQMANALNSSSAHIFDKKERRPNVVLIDNATDTEAQLLIRNVVALNKSES